MDNLDQQQQRRVMVSSDSSDEEMFKDAANYAGIIPPDVNNREHLMAEGRALYEAQKFKEAELVFLTLKENDLAAPGPVSAQTANNLSACMLRLGDHEGALQNTDAVLKVDPENVKALCRQWFSYGRLGKVHEAAKTLSTLCRLGLSEKTQGEVDTHAEALTVDEERRGQERCDQLRKEGNEMLKTGQKLEAVKRYTAALKQQPLDLPTWNNRAQAYLHLERFEEAEKDATAVLRLDPGNSKAIYRRGRARLGRPQPDMEAGCADLARIVSENPKNKEAREALAQAVEHMALDGGSLLATQNDRSTRVPAEEEIVNMDFEAATGDGMSSGANETFQDEHASLLSSPMASQADAGADHDEGKTRCLRPLMIVEEDDSNGGGCSWCPLVPDESEEDAQASVEYWTEGERCRDIKDWTQALEMFRRGAVANPTNAACWIGLSRMHRKLQNYTDSFKAAYFAQETAPSSALLCMAVAKLIDKSTDQTHSERVQYAVSVQKQLEALHQHGTVDQHWESCEEDLLFAICPRGER